MMEPQTQDQTQKKATGLSKYMGYASVAITQEYIRICDEDVRNTESRFYENDVKLAVE